jgi:CDP-diacylglycerol--glycerol-3-phosphate 3-phosphatidyltransferase
MNIANAITVVRIALAPTLVLLAWLRLERPFLLLLAVALVSDIVDGQIARCCNLATPLGAKLDSWADFLTALTLPFGIVWLRPELLTDLRGTFSLAVASYLVPIAFGFAKFRALTSYHTTLARIAAYLVGAAVLVLFARGPTWPLQAAVSVLTISAIEEIAISIRLRRPRSNVRSFRNAARLEREERGDRQ